MLAPLTELLKHTRTPGEGQLSTDSPRRPEEVRLSLSQTLCFFPFPQIFGGWRTCLDGQQTSPFISTSAVTLESSLSSDEISSVVRWKEFWRLPGSLSVSSPP